MTFNRYFKTIIPALAVSLLAALTPASPAAAAATTSVTLIRLAADGETENEKVIMTYQEMESDLEVWGDGEIHYYHQGPVFVDDEDDQVEAALRWNEEENNNIEKDMGAVKGTNIKDLCDLIGGMEDGQEIEVVASDGWSDTFGYENVYDYSPREGPIILTWYRDGEYPDDGYFEGMRLVWFADTSGHEEEGLHVFGNWDWYEAAEPQYWYYFYQGEEKYPTTSGLSGQKISEIIIKSSDPPWWDLDEDQKCSLADVDLIGEQWGQSGDEGWIAEDVNRDGEINILDVCKLGQHWEKSY